MLVHEGTGGKSIQNSRENKNLPGILLCGIKEMAGDSIVVVKYLFNFKF